MIKTGSGVPENASWFSFNKNEIKYLNIKGRTILRKLKCFTTGKWSFVLVFVLIIGHKDKTK